MKTLCRLFYPKIKYLILIAVIGLSIAGCMKEEEDSTTLVKIDKSLYPFLFDKGSYWVYSMYPLKADTLKTVIKDSLGLARDSIVFVNDTIAVKDSVSVVSIEKDTLYLSGNVRYYEYFKIMYQSAVQKSLYEEDLIGYVISRGLIDGGYLLLSSKKKGDKSKNAELVGIIDELKVGDKTYRQVVKMKVIRDQYINDNYYLYYLNNIGIIRKEKEVNKIITETWDLTKYNIKLFKITD